MAKSKNMNLTKAEKTEKENFLLLNENDGHSIKIKPEQIANWVKKLDKHGHSDSELSRFGLKNANDVIYFLNSHAGKEVRAEIGAELALISAIEEERRIELQDKNLFRRRLLAFLIFSLIAYRKAHARDQMNAVQEQINKKIHNNSNKKKTSKTTSYNQAKLDILAGYEAEIEILAHEREIVQRESQELQKEIENHKKKLADLEYKHSIYDNVLDELHMNMDYLENKLAINAPAPLTKEQYLEKEKAMKELEAQISGLLNEIGKKVEKVSHFLTKGEHEKAQKTTYKLHGLNFKTEFLKDLMELALGNKHLFDANGEKTNSLSDAKFILKPEKKIVQHEGQLYLINDNEDIHKLSLEQKKEAADRFKNSKPEVTCIHKMVQENKQIELQQHKQKVKILEERHKQNTEHEKFINSQLKQLRKAKTTSEDLLNNPADLMAHSLKPRMELNQSSQELEPSSVSTSKTLKILAFLHKNEPKLSRRVFLELSKDSPTAKQYVQQQFNKIPYSAPIPHIMMVEMLKNLERFGIDATKPGMTNIQSITDFRTSQLLNPEPKEKLAPSSAPSPFKTTPNPYS